MLTCPDKDPVIEIIAKWKLDAGVKSPVLIKYDYKTKVLFIYTTHPGYFIGVHGTLFNKYKSEIISELMYIFGKTEEPDIKFVECYASIK